MQISHDRVLAFFLAESSFIGDGPLFKVEDSDVEIPLVGCPLLAPNSGNRHLVSCPTSLVVGRVRLEG